MESSHGSAIEGEASLNSENQAVINEHYEGMNDDDMDYEPTDGSAEDEFLFEEEEDDDDDEFQDAEDSYHPLQLEVRITDENEDEPGLPGADQNAQDTATEEPDGDTTTRPLFISRDQIIRLLGHADIRHIFEDYSSGHRHRLRNDDSDSESEAEGESRPRKRRPRGRAAFEKVPSAAGTQLIESGTFGTNERPPDSIKRRKKMAYRVMMRELARDTPSRQRSINKLITQDLIPSTNADMIIHYDSRCYSGQFSDDGNFFFSCAQDFKVRMYDTSNPYRWRYYKTVNYDMGQWTITDATLSPDNKFLAYSSIRNIVCLAPTDPSDDSEPHRLDFSRTARRASQAWSSYAHFGIWSLRFSGDGREIVAGAQDNSVYVYDVEMRQSVVKIHGHNDDVNAVCFGDQQSPHILYSGSDDTTLKVWDRRSLADGREAGVFLGHTEGLTYVDSKGDGRFVLSNAKDQTAKLWDLRKMISTEKADKIDPQRYTSDYDYRFNRYDVRDWSPHPHDCSLVTFRGHEVLKTLIRCHFSPPGSSDSRYVYSGSHDGSVYIWNMDATLKDKVNVLEATRDSRPRDHRVSDEYFDLMGRDNGEWRTCVRDASWHPYAPIIAATSWNGWGTSLGTCSVHSWNDGLEADEGRPSMGMRVNAELERDMAFYEEGYGLGTSTRRSRASRLRRRLADDDE